MGLSGSHWNSVFEPHWRSLEFIGGGHSGSVVFVGRQLESLGLSGSSWASVGFSGSSMVGPWGILEVIGVHWGSLGLRGGRWRSVELSGSRRSHWSSVGASWAQCAIYIYISILVKHMKFIKQTLIHFRKWRKLTMHEAKI